LAIPHLCELGEGHVERVDQAQEVEEADVGLPSLDRADVVAVCRRRRSPFRFTN